LRLKEAAGALVSGTERDSPAAKAGIKPGDVITSINLAKVKDSRDLARQVGSFAPRTGITVEYLRDGKPQTATVTLGQMKEQTARRPHSPALPGAEGQASNLGI